MNNILIVDDDPHIRELAWVFLKREGFETHEASDGVEALSILEETKADLAIIDIMMPRMDGWELCRQLRELYDFPILMLTAKGETSQKLKGFQLGTDDYLVKPFESMELVARVNALLKRYRIATSQSIQVGGLSRRRQFYSAVRSGKTSYTDGSTPAKRNCSPRRAQRTRTISLWSPQSSMRPWSVSEA